MPVSDTYRGWTISQGRWPEPAWSATGPNYDAWTEGEGEWADNGERADAPTREGLITEIDAWFEENEPEPKCACEGTGKVWTSRYGGNDPDTYQINCPVCDLPSEWAERRAEAARDDRMMGRLGL